MSSDQYSAVLFCEKGRISREMMYAEFEAILDSFVPLTEYAGRDIKAIYVQITPQLKVEAAVYFLIGFDGEGNADRKWNIPLVQLAEQGEPGPNLGAGPIRLSCKSQCSVSWQVQNLWDPDMSKEPNDFVLLRDVVKRNRLGFKKIEEEVEEIPSVTEKVEDIPTVSADASNALLSALAGGEDASEADKALSASLVQFLRKKIDEEGVSEREEVEKKQKLLLAAQKTKFEDEISKLEELHSEELRQTQERMQEYNTALSERTKEVDSLQQQLKEQTEALKNAQDLFEKKLEKSKESDGSQIEALKKSWEEDMKRKMELLAKEYTDLIAEKDMELAYKDQEKTGLQNEVDKLNNEKAQLIGQGGEQFLNRLKENNVSFVVYHQGAGHINIEIDNIGEYLSNPTAYVAESCNVSEEAYLQWIKHHDNPVCQSYSDSKGDVCGKKLKAVVSPSQFIPGRSDRCPLHWSFADEA